MFNPADYPDLLVGLGVPDDAAVYRLDAERAIIVTTDFFTPIVDDPYQYGAIAAANALSDVYAMGGRPLLALNIAALPPDLPLSMIAALMRGSAEKVREAGAVIAGGHTIQDREPKIGLAVMGIVHPDRLLTKDGARPGDILVLTKPLGTGSITTAAKNDRADPAHVEEAVNWMVRLNRAAAEAACAVGACAATDITGFGFLGHASEMADASHVTLHVHFPAVPLLEGTRVYADQWIFPGGSVSNKMAFEKGISFDGDLSQEEQMILFDAQTSGGLLIAIPAGQLEAFNAEMTSRDTPWWQIGTVGERSTASVIVSNRAIPS